jgi:pyruvate carboxylase subunit B
MRYVVDLNGERLEVEVEGDSVVVNGEPDAVRVEDVPGTPIRLVTVGSQVHRVVVRRGSARGAYTLWVAGWRFEGEALDERTRAIRDITAATSGPSGPAPVVAPMPGLIVRVNVAVGDEVHLGQAVVAIEAMKMENELRAPAAGRVAAVHIVSGSAVEKGKTLVEFE